MLSLRHLAVLDPVRRVLGQRAPHYLKHVVSRHDLCLARSAPLRDFGVCFPPSSRRAVLVVAASTMALRIHLEPYFGVTPPQHVDALLRRDGITPTPTANLSTVLNLFMPTAPATMVREVTKFIPGIVVGGLVLSSLYTTRAITVAPKCIPDGWGDGA